MVLAPGETPEDLRKRHLRSVAPGPQAIHSCSFPFPLSHQANHHPPTQVYPSNAELGSSEELQSAILFQMQSRGLAWVFFILFRAGAARPTNLDDVEDLQLCQWCWLTDWLTAYVFPFFFKKNRQSAMSSQGQSFVGNVWIHDVPKGRYGAWQYISAHFFSPSGRDGVTQRRVMSQNTWGKQQHLAAATVMCLNIAIQSNHYQSPLHFRYGDPPHLTCNKLLLSNNILGWADSEFREYNSASRLVSMCQGCQ